MSSPIRPFVFLLALGGAGLLAAGSPPRALPACDPDDGGLDLPDGFCAVLVAEAAGPVRHLAVAPNGDIYAALSGRRGGETGVLALRDTDGDGKADLTRRFGREGGSGIALYRDWLYFATDDGVIRWRRDAGQLEPAGEPEVIVRGLPTGGHGAKGLVIRNDTSLFISIGSRTNSCQVADRRPRSPGQDPCPELATRAGIWRFSAVRPNQSQQDGERYATGLRNPMAMALQPGSGTLYAAMHGRDQLGANWGYSDQDNAEKPAEEFVRVNRGDDFGWPYCYYDPIQKKKVLAPEYGGDGREIGRCGDRKDPVIGFPGHWAPNDIVFYDGTRFPGRFRGGVFLAFHGSWNRAPLPQAGYKVVFAPFRDGRATGEWIDFATARGNPLGIRPSGLAVGPDGSLYLAADQNGKIWRIMPK